MTKNIFGRPFPRTERLLNAAESLAYMTCAAFQAAVKWQAKNQLELSRYQIKDRLRDVEISLLRGKGQGFLARLDASLRSNERPDHGKIETGDDVIKVLKYEAETIQSQILGYESAGLVTAVEALEEEWNSTPQKHRDAMDEESLLKKALEKGPFGPIFSEREQEAEPVRADNVIPIFTSRRQPV